MTGEQRVLAGFRALFHEEPRWLARAPGRVNLIGEHTDYNDGFVMPMAIDRSIWIALRARSDALVRVRALDQGEWGEFDLNDLVRGEGWLEYLKGVAWALKSDGHELKGWEGVMGGNVPLGAGLSSSAALEIATARAFHEVSGFTWDGKAVALAAQRAENEWVGAKTGIMDQLISALGREGAALLIDCRTLETEPVSLPTGTVVVVMDTGTRHSHTESGYNERREECEEAARRLGVKTLRDATLEDVNAHAGALGEVLMRRARHVVSENERVLQAASAMRAGDAEALGELMNASHESLRSDFEVSSEALDVMVECARQHPACLGARMTGGGFGGSAVALVVEGAEGEFMEVVGHCYEEKTGKIATNIVCRPGGETEAVSFPMN